MRKNIEGDERESLESVLVESKQKEEEIWDSYIEWPGRWGKSGRRIYFLGTTRGPEGLRGSHPVGFGLLGNADQK